MKRHKDLIAFMKDQGLRMTESKKVLIQFFIDRQNQQIPIEELTGYIRKKVPDLDRSTLYRNIEKFRALELIQELDLPGIGRVFQFTWGRPVKHFYICKVCRKVKKGDGKLFGKIERALKDIHDFEKSNLSVVFYGQCRWCQDKKKNKKARKSTEVSMELSQCQ